MVNNMLKLKRADKMAENMFKLKTDLVMYCLLPSKMADKMIADFKDGHHLYPN